MSSLGAKVDLRTPDGPPAASNPRGCLGKLVASIDYQIGRPISARDHHGDRPLRVMIPKSLNFIFSVSVRPGAPLSSQWGLD